MPVKMWQPRQLPSVEIAPGLWATPHWERNGEATLFDAEAALSTLTARAALAALDAAPPFVINPPAWEWNGP